MVIYENEYDETGLQNFLQRFFFEEKKEKIDNAPILNRKKCSS